jgi:hypothetical protein
MKTKSTYSLLLNAEAEDKGRALFEKAVYSLVVISTAMTMWAFAMGSVRLPGDDAAPRETARVISTQIEQPLIAAAGN